MKYQILSLALATLLALTPAYAQSSRRSARGGATPAGKAAEEAPAHGVRFVIVSATGGKLPSPLFYKAGKDTYKKVSISSRIPTPRIKPEAGVIKFYDEDPTPAQANAAGNSRAPKAEAKKMPEPVLSFQVPTSAGEKSLCIVVPGAKTSDMKTFYLNEEKFPAKGVHLINLSPRAVTIYTTTNPNGDLNGVKGEKVGPYRSKDGVTEENSWHDTKGDPSDEKKRQVAFRITTMQPTKGNKKGGAIESTVRMGKFVVSDRQGQINFVVKDGAKDSLKLLSVQLAADK